MTEIEIRKVIAEALESSNVIAFRYNNQKKIFLENQCDIHLSQLKIDSLATMEICIAIELNIGVSIIPEQLSQMSTLNNLVTSIMNYD